MRPQDIEDAKRKYALSLLGDSISGLPPGYIAGFELTLSGGNITIGPGIANIFGMQVARSTSTQITDDMWGVPRLKGKYYYIYISKWNEFYIDQLAPSVLSGAYGYYHPSTNYRYLGKLYNNSYGQFQYVVTEGSARAESLDIGSVKAEHMSIGELTAGTFLHDDSEPIPDGTELFDLSNPACKSSDDLNPAQRLIWHEPDKYFADYVTEYANPMVKWNAGSVAGSEDAWTLTASPTGKGFGVSGFFQASTNLVTDPEDFTGTDWSTTNATVTLDVLTFNGRKFSKIVSSANNGSANQVIAFTGDGVKSFHIVLRKGTEQTNSRAWIRDTTAPANRLDFYADWTTQTTTVVAGTLLKEIWYGTDIVEWYGLTSSVTAANTNGVLITPSLDDTGTVYATMAMASDDTFISPYCAGDRLANVLNYYKTMPEQFTVMFWVRPWFEYNVSTFRTFFEFALSGDATTRFIIYYASADDTIRAQYTNSNVRVLVSQVFDDGSSYTDINQWIHVAAKVDLSTGDTTGSALWINGVQKDITWDGNIDAYATDITQMSVGYSIATGANCADSLMTDLLFDDSLLDDQVIIDHYNNARPWYDPTEISNYEQTVRINKSGIKLYNTSLNISDRFGRDIDISNASGLMARDAQGKIIHDIPNDVILSDMIYNGHLVFKEAPDFIDAYSYENTGVATGDSFGSGVRNVDLSSLYPGNLTNVKGIKASVYIRVNMDDLKTQEEANVWAYVRFSTEYNVAPTAFNIAAARYIRAGTLGADDVEVDDVIIVQADIPIVNGTYITWSTTGAFASMQNGDDNWLCQTYLYLLGFWI